ncbi:50S ribosomal protein L15e [Candidatus Woesearchaeota archaeon]|nr:50S ribosomal protein L15e [Candidatus Woesearchaeota archaeon]
MGMYKYIRKAWKKPKKNMPEIWRERLLRWRREPSTVRIKKPTRIDRARSLGYKAKQGFIVVRQKIPRGGKKRQYKAAGRRPKTSRRRLVLDKNYKQVAEERANKKYPNCEVLNSYEVAEDGKNSWYEIILVDTSAPEIRKDKDINWIIRRKHKGRAYRGKTSAGRKSRGLRNKGKGAEKLRPSKKANIKRRK